MIQIKIPYELSGHVFAASEACASGDQEAAANFARMALECLSSGLALRAVDLESASKIIQAGKQNGWAGFDELRSGEETCARLACEALGLLAAQGGVGSSKVARGKAEAMAVAMASSKSSGSSMESLGILIGDAKGVMISSNKRFAELTGYPESEIVGRNCSFLQGERTDQAEVRRMRECMAAGVVFEGSVLNYKKDGSAFWNQLSILPMHGAGGVEGFVGVTRDATDSKAQQDQLALLKMAVSKINDIVLITEAEPYDAPGPRIVYANEAFERRTGYALSEVIGKTPRILQGAKTDKAELRRVRQALERWESVRSEVINYAKDGREFWLEMEITPIADEKGWFTHWVAVERDITERKRAERELAESQNRLRSIVENEPQCVKVIDFDGSLIEMNAAGLSMLQATNLSEVNARGLLSFVSQESREELGQAFARASQGQTSKLVYKVKGLHGREGLFKSVVSPLGPMVDGRSQVLAITDDVTEEEAAKARVSELNESLEQKVMARTSDLARVNEDLLAAHQTLSGARDRLVEQEKLSALGGLVSGLSHELNTPLGNGLLMSSTMEHKLREFELRLAPGAAPLARSELRAFVEQIGECSRVFTANVQKAATLVASFKQVAVDRMAEKQRAFLLTDLARDVLLTMTPTIKASRVEIEVAIDENVRMDGYPGRLGQVLSNLIDNAILHGFEGLAEQGRAPKLAIRGSLENAQTARFSVADNGVGISAAHRKKIFEPFFTTRAGRGGTGLGLHIVRSIVVGVLGGSMELESSSESGSTFTMLLPLNAPTIVSESEQG